MHLILAMGFAAVLWHSWKLQRRCGVEHGGVVRSMPGGSGLWLLQCTEDGLYVLQVPLMAAGVADLKRELCEGAAGLTEMPEIHQFLDGFYLSRIGIRILIGEEGGMRTLSPTH